jgi:hypothetical protein
VTLGKVYAAQSPPERYVPGCVTAGAAQHGGSGAARRRTAAGSGMQGTGGFGGPWREAAEGHGEREVDGEKGYGES